MSRNDSITKGVDWGLILIVLLLMVMGITNLYSAAHNEKGEFLFDIKTMHGKQIMWIGVASFLGFISFLIDAKFIRKLSPSFYVFTLFLLVAVLFTKPINGARSWLGLGPFGIQPSEFAKLGMALILSYFISNMNTKQVSNRAVFTLLGLLFGTMLLILLQNDTGTFLVFTAFLFVMYREGITFDPIILFFTNKLLGLKLKQTWLGVHFIPILFVVVFYSILCLYFADSKHIIHLGFISFENVPGWFMFQLILVAITGIIWFISHRIGSQRNRKRITRAIVLSYMCFALLGGIVALGYTKVLQSHQKIRIDLWLGKVENSAEKDGEDYNRNRAMAAVGSGGLLGNGYQQAQLASPESGHVPESETDFIFSVFSEEWGFVGSASVVVLFTLLLMKIIQIAERQKSRFSRVYAYSVAMIIFYHFGINIGMNIGIVPIIGIPLPFFSYGGSSMMSFTMMIMILLKLDSQRKEMIF